ncbi:hypothetical protein J416_09434 [Gracilibacillus halophilus YIM-C55.5]|uniref:Uncharacterized protein n=1 Tax=Gracilibacillus halophilus YIM-C55.5 TaxID=1308866 RepID=N4WBR9_9BACI|nr:hypothetical protein [Gracilibacillus halophilus]ENH96709.1 hypothetical protein J416_09434 [Gracilibacillus halophilus YIM-C55.5]
MNAQERLEKCKQFANADDIDWLIDQVQKKQELEVRCEIRDETVKYSGGKLNELEQQIRRYEEALQFYADPKIYNEGYLPPAVLTDGGRIAEKALHKPLSNK